MVIYESKVSNFLDKVQNPRLLAEEIQMNMKDKFGITVADNEYQSWVNSLPKVANIIKNNKNDLRYVLIEFNIPTSKQRIDFIVLGKSIDGNPSGVILELKQWSSVTEVEWNEFRVGRYLDTHPSYQARDYRDRLLHEMGLDGNIDLESHAYLFNLNNNKSPLFNETYEEALKASWLYSDVDSNKLEGLIQKHTFNGSGEEALELFRGADWKPSKKFKEWIEEDFENMNLVGSQKQIYEKIEKFIKSKKHNEKMTFIISGDPGSGKTVIAFKLMLLMLKELEMKIQFMLPGQEVREAFKYNNKNAKFTTRISGSKMWNDFDAAIIDEAHKAQADGFAVANYRNNIFNKMNFGIIFIDNNQVISKKGISKEELADIARDFGHVVHEYEIQENFRHLGERTIIDWIDYVFYDKEVQSGDFTYKQIKYINKNMKYKLCGYSSADDFVESYYQNYNESNSTRMTSLWHQGFYNGKADENGDVPGTIEIGKYKFAWNPNAEWFKNISEEDKQTYNKDIKRYALRRETFLVGKPKKEWIAYFNHIQGYEFENIFVYIPNVFTYEDGEIKFHYERLADEVRIHQAWSPTSKAKLLGDKDPYIENKKMFLNRIKVMLTRGTKSTHVFAEDPALNKYIKEKIA